MIERDSTLMAISWQFIKYCLVGVINTLVCVSVMALLAYLGAHYLLYTFFGYLVGITVSFTLNFRLTFASQGYVYQRLMRFFGVNLLNLGITESIQFILIEWIHLPESVAVGMGMISYVFVGYFANKRWVFHRY